jgi:MFS family permease
MAITGGRFLAPFLEHEGNSVITCIRMLIVCHGPGSASLTSSIYIPLPLCLLAGFSDSLIGTVLGVQYGIMSITAPLYGHLADKRELKCPNYGRAQVLSIGIFFGIIFFSLHGANYIWPSCQYLTSWHWHFAIQCMYACCLGILFPVMDGMTLDFLRNHMGDSKDYGKERLYGAIWWGISNLVFGPLIDRFGFVVAYPCALLLSLVSLAAIFYYARGQALSEMPNPLTVDKGGDSDKISFDADETPVTSETSTNSEGDVKKDASAVSKWFLIHCVVATSYGAAFIFMYFILASGLSVVENMVFLFFEYLGGSNTICGITVAISVMFEVPIFQVAPNLLRKYGAGLLMLAANVAFVIRIVGYTIIPDRHIFWVLIFEPLHGVTYACSQTAAVEYVAERMPRGAEASGQGIINFVRGSGSVIGLCLGGVIQDTFGPRVMYRLFAFTITIGMSIFTLVGCKSQEEHYDPIVEVLV